MNLRAGWLMGCVALLQAGWMQGATMPGVINRESLHTASSLEWLSVGLNFESIQRGVEVGIGGGTVNELLEAYAGDVLVGIDVSPSVSLFVTAGASAVMDEGLDETGDTGGKWSAGLAANLWQYDLVNPEWMSGTLSIRVVGEFSGYESDLPRGGGSIDWMDISLALPFCYEMFEDLSPLKDPSLRVSLNLYVGPVVSMVDGTLSEAGADIDFDEEQSVGIVAGGDIYVAANLSLGAYARIFDETTVGGSLRFHF